MWLTQLVVTSQTVLKPLLHGPSRTKHFPPAGQLPCSTRKCAASLNVTSWEGCSREIRIEVLQLLTESWEGLFWNTSILQKKGIRRVRNRKQTEVWGDCPCQHSKLISGELLCGKGKKKENHRRVPETSFTDDCPKGLLLGVFCQNEYAYLTCNEL